MVTIPGTLQQYCRWNCAACGAGTVFTDGCVKVDGPQVCPQDGYEYYSQRHNGSCCPTPTPTPTPGGGPQQPCYVTGTCPDTDDNPGGGGGIWSPVLVDVAGDSFALTDAAGGVKFDLNSDGTAEHLN